MSSQNLEIEKGAAGSHFGVKCHFKDGTWAKYEVPEELMKPFDLNGFNEWAVEQLFTKAAIAARFFEKKGDEYKWWPCVSVVYQDGSFSEAISDEFISGYLWIVNNWSEVQLKSHEEG